MYRVASLWLAPGTRLRREPERYTAPPPGSTRVAHTEGRNYVDVYDLREAAAYWRDNHGWPIGLRVGDAAVQFIDDYLHHAIEDVDPSPYSSPQP